MLFPTPLLSYDNTAILDDDAPICSANLDDVLNFPQCMLGALPYRSIGCAWQQQCDSMVGELLGSTLQRYIKGEQVTLTPDPATMTIADNRSVPRPSMDNEGRLRSPTKLQPGSADGNVISTVFIFSCFVSHCGHRRPNKCTAATTPHARAPGRIGSPCRRRASGVLFRIPNRFSAGAARSEEIGRSNLLSVPIDFVLLPSTILFLSDHMPR